MSIQIQAVDIEPDWIRILWIPLEFMYIMSEANMFSIALKIYVPIWEMEKEKNKPLEKPPHQISEKKVLLVLFTSSWNQIIVA